jgi:hypothetical protein
MRVLSQRLSRARLGALLCAMSLSLGASAAEPAKLPPLPVPSASALSSTPPPATAQAVDAAPAAASSAEAPLLEPGPTDLPVAASACSALPAKGAQWMDAALAGLQGQSLRPGGSLKAKNAFAEVWIFFKASRAKGYDMDGSVGKIDAVYRALYPASPFTPETPFERFKEPRKSCKKLAF